jgi:hypothetical protein
VSARRFVLVGDRGLAAYSAVSGAGVLALLLSTANEDVMSLALRAATALGCGWASVVAVRLSASLGPRSP